MRTFAFYILLTMVAIAVSEAKPMAWINVDTVDFGAVPTMTKFYRTITLKSIGDQPLVIDSVNTFCDCVSLPMDKKVLPPGDSLVTRLAFYSANYSGQIIRVSHIYTNAGRGSYLIPVTSFVVQDMEKYRPIYVKPIRIAASQYGETGQTKYPFQILNNTDSPIPLKLIRTDKDFFDLDFPVFVPASGVASGTLTLNKNGVDKEFETNITFEFINEESLVKRFSIPVFRKIYRRGN
ncbi:MAG: DUF1573 domain-containing protein [candidate division Zixibacteria bacterium]|nr:DUF1573 domain-containing protein [candidate division Zixibacteria bacterium]